MGYVNCATCKRDCIRADGSFGYTICDKYICQPKSNSEYLEELTDEAKSRVLSGLFYQVAQKTNAEHYILEWLKKPAEE